MNTIKVFTLGVIILNLIGCTQREQPKPFVEANDIISELAPSTISISQNANGISAELKNEVMIDLGDIPQETKVRKNITFLATSNVSNLNIDAFKSLTNFKFEKSNCQAQLINKRTCTVTLEYSSGSNLETVTESVNFSSEKTFTITARTIGSPRLDPQYRLTVLPSPANMGNFTGKPVRIKLTIQSGSDLNKPLTFIGPTNPEFTYENYCPTFLKTKRICQIIINFSSNSKLSQDLVKNAGFTINGFNPQLSITHKAHVLTEDSRFAFTSTSLDFGTLSSSSSRTVKLLNMYPETISNLTRSGSLPAGLSITADSCTNGLATKRSCSVRFSLNPAQAIGKNINYEFSYQNDKVIARLPIIAFMPNNSDACSLQTAQAGGVTTSPAVIAVSGVLPNCSVTSCSDGNLIAPDAKSCIAAPEALIALSRSESIETNSYTPVILDYKKIIKANNNNYDNVTFTVVSSNLSQGGDVTCSANNVCYFAPKFAGNYSFVLKGQRATGQEATATINISVFGSENVPVFNDPAKQVVEVAQGSTIDINLIAATSGSDPIRYEVGSYPGQGSLTHCLNLQFSDNATSDLSCKYTATGDLFTTSFTYKAINTINNKFAVKEVQINFLDSDTVLDVFPGNNASLALNDQGYVFGRGLNNSRLFGIDSDYQIASFVFEGNSAIKVPLPDKVVKLFVKKNSAIAKLANGKFFVWGENNKSKLGVYSGSIIYNPVEATSFYARNFSQIVINESSSCGLDSENDVYCWGSNELGELGNNVTTNNDPTLRKVSFGTKKVTALAESSANASHHCAIVENELYCWGQNDQGQLGIGLTNAALPSTYTPTKVLLTEGVKKAAIGEKMACAITNSDAVKCWGKNDFGQLGAGDTTVRGTTSSSMAALAAINLGNHTVREVYVGAGGSSVCAILNDYKVKCWGKNNLGQLGSGDTTSKGVNASDMGSNLPYVKDLNNVPLLGAFLRTSGTEDFCLRTNSVDGKVYCWGSNLSTSISNVTPFFPSVPREYSIIPGDTAPFLSSGSNTSFAFNVNQNNPTNLSNINPTQFKDLYSNQDQVLYFFDETTVNIYTGVVYDKLDPTKEAGRLSLNCLSGISRTQLNSCTFTPANNYIGTFDVKYKACSANLKCSDTKISIAGRVLDPVKPYFADNNTNVTYQIKPYQALNFQVSIPNDPLNRPNGIINLNLEKNPLNNSYYLVYDTNQKVAGVVGGCSLSITPVIDTSNIYSIGSWRNGNCTFYPREDFMGTAEIQYQAVNSLNQRSEVRTVSIQVVNNQQNILHFTGYRSDSFNYFGKAYRQPEVYINHWYTSEYINAGGSDNAAASYLNEREPYPSAILAQINDDLDPNKSYNSAFNITEDFISSVSGISNFRENACVIYGANKEVICWGGTANNYNANGALHQYSYYNPSVSSYKKVANPAMNGHLDQVSKVAMGERMACAIKGNDKAVYCWGKRAFGCGERSNGQERTIGNGGASCLVKTDTQDSLVGAEEISVGAVSACAIINNNNSKELYCWGYRLDTNGVPSEARYLNIEDTNSSNVRDLAYKISLSKNPKNIKVGSRAACVVYTDNTLDCFGYNDYAQISNPSSSNFLNFTSVKYNSADLEIKPETLTINDYFSCAVGSNNKLYCWGYSPDTRLLPNTSGHFSTKEFSFPFDKPVKFLTSINDTICAQANDNQVYCWGRNNYGQLGKADSTYISFADMSSILTQPNGNAIYPEHFALLSNSVFFVSPNLIQNQNWFQQDFNVIEMAEGGSNNYNLFNTITADDEFIILKKPNDSQIQLNNTSNYGEISISNNKSLDYFSDGYYDYITYINKNEPNKVLKLWIKVSAANQSPILRPRDFTATVAQDSYIPASYLGVDPESRGVYMKVVNAPTKGVFTCYGQAPQSNDFYSYCYYKPNAGTAGQLEEFSYQLFDGEVSSQSTTAKIYIRENASPVLISSNQTFNITSFENLSFTLNSAFYGYSDISSYQVVSGIVNDAGVWKVISSDEKTIGIINQPWTCGLTNGSSRTCQFIPIRGAEGTVVIKYKAIYSGNVSSEEETLTININNTNVQNAIYTLGYISEMYSGKYQTESYLYRLQGGANPSIRYGDAYPFPFIADFVNSNSPSGGYFYGNGNSVFLKNISSIDISRNNSSKGCAVSEGKVYCWGDTMIHHHPYLSNAVYFPAFKNDGTYLDQVSKVSVGDDQSCAIRGSNKELYCWGRTASSNIANNSAPLTSGCGSYDTLTKKGHACQIVKPGHIPLTDVEAVATSSSNANVTCAIVKENNKGQVYCWGMQINGFNGVDASFSPESDPKYYSNFAIKVSQFENEDVKNIKLNYRAACVTLASGKISCFGQSSSLFGPEVNQAYSGYVTPKFYTLGAQSSNQQIQVSVARDQITVKSPIVNSNATLSSFEISSTEGSISATSEVENVGGGKRFTATFSGVNNVSNYTTSIIYNDGTEVTESGNITVDLVDPTFLEQDQYVMCTKSTNGKVYCWGSDSSQSLKANYSDPYFDRRIPTNISHLSAINPKTFKLNNGTFCYTNQADELYCIGNNAYGKAGNESGMGVSSSGSVGGFIAAENPNPILNKINGQIVKPSFYFPGYYNLLMVNNGLDINIDPQPLEVDVLKGATLNNLISDVDTNQYEYFIIDKPSYGTLEGELTNLSYKASDSYTGTVFFTYRVYDKQRNYSVIKRVIIKVNNQNLPPVVHPKEHYVKNNYQYSFHISASDPEYSNSLQYSVETNPQNAEAFSCNGSYCTYKAPENFTGEDFITFRVSDGTSYSTGQHKINVVSSNLPQLKNATTTVELSKTQSKKEVTLPRGFYINATTDSQPTYVIDLNSNVTRSADGSVYLSQLGSRKIKVTDCFVNGESSDLSCSFNLLDASFTGSLSFGYKAKSGNEISSASTIVTVNVTQPGKSLYAVGYVNYSYDVLAGSFERNSQEYRKLGGEFGNNLVDGFVNSEIYPVPVMTPSDVFSDVDMVTTFNNRICIVDNSNNKEVRCSGDKSGPIGRAAMHNYAYEARFQRILFPTSGLNSTISNPKKIAMGENQSCAILQDNSLACWGATMPYVNSTFQDPSGCGFQSSLTTNGDACLIVDNKNVPFSSVIDVALGQDPSYTSGCLIKDEEGQGKIYCWGYKVDGPHSTFVSSTPVAMTSLNNKSAVKVALSHQSICAAYSDNTVQCQGINNYGQIGNNESQSSNFYSAQTLDFKNDSNQSVSIRPETLKAHQYGACVVDILNKLQCWGHNSYGAFNTMSDYPSSSKTLNKPTRIANTLTIKDYDINQLGICVINSSDNVNCWGYNHYGRTGSQLTYYNTNPWKINSNYITVDELTPILKSVDNQPVIANKIYSSYYHTFIVTSQENSFIVPIVDLPTQELAVNEDDSLMFNLETGFDDGEYIYYIFRKPQYGFISGTSTNLQVSFAEHPQSAYIDYFTYFVKNILTGKTLVKRYIFEVSPKNTVPKYTNRTFSISSEKTYNFYHQFTDADQIWNGTYTFTQTSNPAFGSISCSGSYCSYTANTVSSETIDFINFTVTDPQGAVSAQGEVQFIIKPVSNPFFSNSSITVNMTSAQKFVEFVLPAATNPDSSGNLSYQAEDNTIRPTFEGSPFNRNVGMIYSASDSSQAAGFLTDCFLDPVMLNNGDFFCKFTVKNNFTGTAVFKYLASNGSFGSEVVTVTINVTSPNNLPNKLYAMGYPSNWGGFDKSSANYEDRTLVYYYYQPDFGLNIPVTTSVINNFKSIVSNYDNNAICGLTNNGTVFCSSSVGDSLVGLRSNNYLTSSWNNYNIDRWAPINNELGQAKQSEIIDFQMNNYQSCAIVGSEKKIICWQSNFNYQISANTTMLTGCGFNTTIINNGYACPVVDINEVALENVQKIALAKHNSCAIVSENGQGKLYCWGYDIDGTNGSASPRAYNQFTALNHAKLVSGLENDSVIDVKLGDSFGCAVLSDNSIKCWGENDYGQLGRGTTDYHPNYYHYPAQSIVLNSLPKADSLSLQDKLACYIGQDNNLYCWGHNYSIFSDNQSKYSPTLVPGLIANATKIKMRGSSYCALNTSNNLYCWGYNYYGQLGTATNKNTGTIIPITESIPVKKSDNSTNFEIKDFYMGSNQVFFIEN